MTGDAGVAGLAGVAGGAGEGPATPVRPVIAVDVGGTSIKAGVLGPDGRLGPVDRTPTPAAGPDGLPVVDAVEAIVRRLAGSVAGSPSGAGRAGAPAGVPPGAPIAVGVVVPGIVDEAAGVAVHAENLGWRDMPLRSLLADRLGCPVAVGHDVRAGGLAEHRLGACRGEQNAVFLPVGTGIAAALILDGRVLAAEGYAGELGHVDVGHDLPCACGGHGCLEAIASAAAIARRYALAAGAGVAARGDSPVGVPVAGGPAADGRGVAGAGRRDSSSGSPAGGAPVAGRRGVAGPGDPSSDAPVAGSREVAELVRRGDPAAVAVWDEALDALAYALSLLVGVVAPGVVAIGGGLGESPDLVLQPLTDRLAKRLTFQRRPRIVAAELGDRAGCVGAGLLARELIA